MTINTIKWVEFHSPDGEAFVVDAGELFGTTDMDEIYSAAVKYKESKTLTKAIYHLKRYVAAALETDIDHLDPKDVMRFDRDVYDFLYVHDDE